jgi:hypothetical protein
VTTFIILLAGTALALPAVAAEPDAYDGQWRFGVTPYGWFPGIKGDLRFTAPGGNPSVNINPDNYLTDLQFAGMLAASARKGNFALFTDIVYVDLASLSSRVRDLRGPGGITIPVNVDVNVGIKALVWTAGGSYTVVRNGSMTLDVLAGARYAGIDASLGADGSGRFDVFSFSRGTTQKVDLWDGIVGVQGAINLGADGKWYVPYELDVGAGSNNWTWNGILGVGYRFGWGDVIVAWRTLQYRMSNDDSLVQNLQLSGPAVGARFSW